MAICKIVNASDANFTVSTQLTGPGGILHDVEMIPGMVWEADLVSVAGVGLTDGFAYTVVQGESSASFGVVEIYDDQTSVIMGIAFGFAIIKAWTHFFKA